MTQSADSAILSTMNKIYPTLYSRTSTGKIQTWRLEQGGPRFRCHHGQKDGAIVVDEWTVCEPKNVGRANETSAEDQCSKEIAARYKKQLKTGYFEDEADVDKAIYFQPQLAHKWEDRRDKVDLSKGAYVSPKLDGVRAIITRQGAFSRNGERFLSFPHILRELETFFEEYPEAILDGEVYCDRLSNDFNKIVSLAKKTKPTETDIQDSEKYLQYWIFDYPSCRSKGFYERWIAVNKVHDKFFSRNRWIKLCPHYLINSELQIEEYLARFIENGYEGIMINTYDGEYLQKRSSELLKYKKFQDDEYEIVSISEGVGNRSGMFGFATLKIGDKTFNSNARGNEGFYSRLLKERKSLIGKMATVRYQALTPDGVPRFPVIVGVRDYE